MRKLHAIGPRLSEERAVKQGHLMEIFSSYQGEGVWAGVRQIFLRLGICHMRCVYCDTPDSWTAQKTYRVERAPMSKEFDAFPNPVGVDRVLEHVQKLNDRAYHSISITGGEPLVQIEFLEALLPALKNVAPIYLETSGTLSDKLQRVADHVDFFALDYKPPSTPGVKTDRDDFRRCVDIARRGHAQVKIVVMENSPTEAEVEEACAIAQDLPIVFTPVTEVNAGARGPGCERLKLLCAAAGRKGVTPLVIPQIHHRVGWL